MARHGTSATTEIYAHEIDRIQNAGERPEHFDETLTIIRLFRRDWRTDDTGDLMKNKKSASAAGDGYDLLENIFIAHSKYVSRAKPLKGRTYVDVAGTEEYKSFCKARKALMKALGKYNEYIESLAPKPF